VVTMDRYTPVGRYIMSYASLTYFPSAMRLSNATRRKNLLCSLLYLGVLQARNGDRIVTRCCRGGENGWTAFRDFASHGLIVGVTILSRWWDDAKAQSTKHKQRHRFGRFMVNGDSRCESGESRYANLSEL